ncbi:MAG: LysR family transcriptional regulator [Burkholderiales bacterium]|nr:LysR family transcriptional regulator [Burkholderiales bacterium]
MRPASAPEDSLQIQLGTIALFCKAAELKSFTAAARVLGLTPAAVSRAVGRLEDRLGVKLLRRTTRSMQLTDDGQLYFAQCRAALGQIDDVEKTITGQHTQARGLLRISLPSTYAHYRLLPRLPAFRDRYPEVELELHVSNRNIDFVEEGYDVAIRQGQPPDSRLVARQLEEARIGVYASPGYLQRHGVPQDLDVLQDATRHTLLPFLMSSTGRMRPWLFQRDGQPVEILPRSTVQTSEDPLGVVTLARAGMGLVQTTQWIADAHPGELIEVLPALAGRTRSFYLLYPHNRNLATRVRVLVDFLCG